MTISLSTPVTGAAQTGFTSPSFTIVSDNYVGSEPGRQYAVTAVGGTGLSGVTAHAISMPFTVAFTRPASPRSLPASNPISGQVANVPNNVTRVITRKGVAVAANQLPRNVVIRSEISVPAGADAYDADDVRAALSLHFGAVNQVSAGLGDTVVTAIL